jgi:hypothetical protein
VGEDLLGAALRGTVARLVMAWIPLLRVSGAGKVLLELVEALVVSEEGEPEGQVAGRNNPNCIAIHEPTPYMPGPTSPWYAMTSNPNIGIVPNPNMIAREPSNFTFSF